MSETEHTPVPWTDKSFIRIHPGDHRLSFGNEAPRVACRVLAECNYQWAKHCVNAHDDLLEACKELLEQHCLWVIPWPQPEKDEFQQAAQVARAAIAKAERPLAATLAGAPKKPTEAG